MKLQTLEAVFSALNQHSVRYLIAGGIAVNIHGYTRMTADLDLVVQLEADNIVNALNALSALGYQPVIPVSALDFADPGHRADWVANKHMEVLGLQSPQFPETNIDLFVTEPFDFGAEYRHADTFDLSHEICIKVVTVRTLIEMKKKAGRHRDLDDIEHLLLIIDETENQH